MDNCQNLGTQFLDLYFLDFIDSFRDESRCVTSGNDTISISLGFVGVCVSVTHFHFLLGFSSEIRLDELLMGAARWGVFGDAMHNKVNVKVGLLLAVVFFGDRGRKGWLTKHRGE